MAEQERIEARIADRKESKQSMLKVLDEIRQNLEAGKIDMLIINGLLAKGDDGSTPVLSYLMVEPSPFGYVKAAGLLRMSSARLEVEYAQRQMRGEKSNDPADLLARLILKELLEKKED